MISFDMLGTEIFAPAIGIGFENARGFADSAQFHGIPAYQFCLDVTQQSGGYCMVYPSFSGMIFPFNINKDKLHTNASDLIKAFGYMAEDPKLNELRALMPKLCHLCGTQGERLSQKQLRNLNEVLDEYARLPSIVGGFEAFGEFEKCDVLNYFRGWKSIRFNISDGSACVEDYTYKNQNLIDGPELTCEVINFLSVLLDRSKEKLRAYFLWENCD